MFSKSFLKIPMSFNSNESSHTNSPAESPVRFIHAAAASSDLLGGMANGGSSRHTTIDRSCVGGHERIPEVIQERGHVGTPEHSIGQDEEVRSKHSSRARRQRAESVTAVCGENGVKSIMDILNCADVQLQTSKDFAEKLAKRRWGHCLSHNMTLKIPFQINER